MSYIPCVFGPCGRKRSDRHRDHCRRCHPSAVDIVNGGRNALGYVFHFLDGHTDRIWATCRGGESPTSVGYCFQCFTQIERNGYKTIELAVAGHTCSARVGETRAKRSTPVTTAAATGGGSAVTHSLPKGAMIVTREYFEELWAESKTDVKGQRAIELVTDDDGEVDVKASMEQLVEDAKAKTISDNQNKKLLAEINSLKESTPMAAPSLDVLTISKMCFRMKKIIDKDGNVIISGPAVYADILTKAKEWVSKNPDDTIEEMVINGLIERLFDAYRETHYWKEESNRIEAERLEESNRKIELERITLTQETTIRARDRDIQQLELVIEELKPKEEAEEGGT